MRRLKYRSGSSIVNRISQIYQGTERMRQKLFVAESGGLVNTNAAYGERKR